MSVFKKILLIIILVVFIAGCVTVTYYAILNTNKLNSEDFSFDLFEKKEDNSYLAVKYDNMHMKNNITTKENVIEIKNGIKYTYYLIDGLKDKQIQNRINNEIEANVLDIVENLKNYDMNYELGFYMQIGFNSSNVLSVILNNYYLAGKAINLTYDLTTGNRIKFSDLFINNCQQELWNIINPSIISYYLESMPYVYNEETGEYDLNPVTEEEFLYKVKKNYNENFDNLDFSLCDESNIVINLIHIDSSMEDFFNDIYIGISDYYYLFTGFTKYLTEESIFENGNLDKNNYTLLYGHYGITPVEEYKDNLFIYIEDNIYTDNEIISDYYNKYVQDIIADYKKKADENLEIATYLQFDLTVREMFYLHAYPNPYLVSTDMFVYTMPKDEYKNNFRKAMFEHNYNYTNEVEYNKDKVECVHVIDSYPIYLDGEDETLIKLSISDFFVEGYDYLAVAKEKLLISLEEEKQYINDEIEVNNMRNAINSLTALSFEPVEMKGYYFYINLNSNLIEMINSDHMSIDLYLLCEDVFDVNMIK